VALIGPHFNASNEMRSIYIGNPNVVVETQTPLLAISKVAQVVAAVPGCVGTTGPNPDNDPNGDTGCLNTSGFAAAAQAAQAADVAIVFVGLTPGQMGNDSSDAREDEGWDRHLTSLPGHQGDLVRLIVSKNPKTVLVLIHGGPLSLEWEKANVSAILDAHYPGEYGGTAIADVLFGNVSPAGRTSTLIYPSNITAARSISNMNLRDAGGLTYRYYTVREGKDTGRPAETHVAH